MRKTVWNEAQMGHEVAGEPSQTRFHLPAMGPSNGTHTVGQPMVGSSSTI